MLRMLAAFALLAIIVASWLIFGQSGDTSDSANGQARDTGGAQKIGTEASPGVANKGAGANLPTPLRMTSPDSLGRAGTPQAPAAEGGSLAEIFDTEEVVTAVAEERTKMIRTVTDSLLKEGEYSAKIKDLQCKSRHCRIKITGEDPKSVSSLIGAMQDERGFYGKAQNLMMSRDGDEIHVYLQFADTQEAEPGTTE